MKAASCLWYPKWSPVEAIDPSPHICQSCLWMFLVFWPAGWRPQHLLPRGMFWACTSKPAGGECWTRGLCTNKLTRAGSVSRCWPSAACSVKLLTVLAQGSCGLPATPPAQLRSCWWPGAAPNRQWDAVSQLWRLRGFHSLELGSFLPIGLLRSSKLLQTWLIY